VCFAVIHALWEVPVRAGALAYLYSFAVSFLGAALRLGCLGHCQAQCILLELRPGLPALAEDALERDLEEMQAFAPLADIRAMQHAYLPVRLFSS
jgi:urease accessory protein